MKHRFGFALGILLLCVILLAGCGSIFPARSTPTPEPTPTPTPAPTPTPTPDPVYDLNFTVGGQQISAGMTDLNLTSVAPTSEEIDRLISVLPGLPSLKSIELPLVDAAAPTVSWEQIRAIQEAAPDITFDYRFSLFGPTFRLTNKVLNLSHYPVSDSSLVLKVAQCMPNLQIIDMDTCGVPDEEMAVIRDALPEVEVIWRVFFGDSYSTRTNVDRLVISNPDRSTFKLTGEAMRPLKYCTAVKYLDLGHLTYLDDCSFAAYMPDLEVLIIAMTGIKDISALANCPKLNYLEYQTSAASDLEPLSGLTRLKDLNICYDLALRDIRPLYGLDLDRLWIGSLTPIPKEQVEEYQRLHPNCAINTTTVNPTEEEWRKLEDGAWPPNSAPRYEQLYNEFQYYNNPGCYAYNDNDTLFWSRYPYPSEEE